MKRALLALLLLTGFAAARLAIAPERQKAKEGAKP